MDINSVILELSKRFFVKRISSDKISVIARFAADLQILPLNYPLKIVEKIRVESPAQYDFLVIK